MEHKAAKSLTSQLSRAINKSYSKRKCRLKSQNKRKLIRKYIHTLKWILLFHFIFKLFRGIGIEWAYGWWRRKRECVLATEMNMTGGRGARTLRRPCICAKDYRRRPSGGGKWKESGGPSRSMKQSTSNPVTTHRFASSVDWRKLGVRSAAMNGSAFAGFSGCGTILLNPLTPRNVVHDPSNLFFFFFLN